MTISTCPDSLCQYRNLLGHCMVSKCIQTRTGEPTVNGQPINTAKAPYGQSFVGTMYECAVWAESIGADDVRIEKVKK